MLADVSFTDAMFPVSVKGNLSLALAKTIFDGFSFSCNFNLMLGIPLRAKIKAWSKTSNLSVFSGIIVSKF